MTTKPVKVHYRRLFRADGNFPGASLAHSIRAALDTQVDDGSTVRESAARRMAPVQSQPEFQRVLNNFWIGDDAVFGTVCLFAPGQMQAFLQVAANSPEATLAEVLEALDIREAAAPDGHEYLHGISYFMAIGDHFYQVQSISLQVAAMEEYLTWLLRDLCQVLSGSQSVRLQSTFDRAQVGDDDLSSIQVGGIVPETVRAPPPPSPAQLGREPTDATAPTYVDVVEQGHLLDGLRATFDRARGILVELLGPIETNRIIELVPPEAALEVTVNIGYRARRRRVSRAFMNELETGLRNLPDGEIIARGRNGEARGDDVRLSQSMNIRRISETSSLLDLDHAREAMMEVHRRFLFDGKITA